MANRVLAPLFNKPKPATFSTVLIAGHEPLQHKPTHKQQNQAQPEDTMEKPNIQ